ncbi:hypothetical protein [Actinacidiphila yeochonensis]|uniref:hypothetical protein n=1 Tax=Actinacidiphila yeochonensis TaxID=89050 RepID=UPI00099D5D68|nr:hypothetical protein [Actinacidiphila yeochonensis]
MAEPVKVPAAAPVTGSRAPGGRDGAAARPRSGRRGAVRDRAWPGAVATAYGLAQLALVVPGTGLGWDETVYTSQVSGSVPAAVFSAPRARGISLLAAPVASWSDSTPLLRVWMAVLSSLGLYLALRAWRTLLPAPVLALAGALFATLWISLFYGPQVMPNLYSAYGAMAAVGCFLRAARDPADRWAPVGLCVGVAVTGLMRPPDAAWLLAPLAVAALLTPGARRPAVWAALAGGAVLGCGEWVVEAYTAYGGLPERLRRASAVQGGTGLNLAVDDQVRALDGRALCRPCTVPWRHPVTAVWFFALPVATAAGVAAGVRAGRRAAVWLPTAVAASMAVPYLFLLGYAAPRFLLPTYLLLAVPVACCGHPLLARARRPAADRRRRIVNALPAALAVVALCAHLAVQGAVARGAVDGNRAMRRAYDTVAARLHAAGVRPPCVLSGDHAVPMAYYARCASRQIGGPDAATTPAGLRADARTRPVALLVRYGRVPAYAAGWRRLTLPDLPALHGYSAYLAPGPAGAAGNGPDDGPAGAAP